MEVSELNVSGASGGVAAMEDGGVWVSTIEAEPKLLNDRDFALIGTACFVVLILKKDIFVFDCSSSSELSSAEAHSRSQLRF
jgi:hypothetical protein